MIGNNNNQYSKQFLQKIILYIDTLLVDCATSSPEEIHKLLVSGVINVRDAILSEIIKDNTIVQINQAMSNNKKNEEKKILEKEKLLDQEKKLVKDQLQ